MNVPEVLVEFSEAVRAEDGRVFVARACGSEMAGGLWQGWIEFVPVDGGEPLRTTRATTQPNREDTVYWATGLTPVYLDGALQRVLRPVPKVPTPGRPASPFFDGPAPANEPARTNGPSVLDPFSVYRKGEGVLRRQLGALSAWHLVNIIQAHGLSEESLTALNAAPPEVLVEIIVEGVRRSASAER
jgi:hypothetical protein